MARVVESIASDYGSTLIWERVITKDLSGAKRYLELSREHGRNLPVPSIVIDGSLVFETTPSQEELRDYLDRMFSKL
ncbi:MAG: hypothetical protein HY879_21110 [Deltaproteobacteria bacterium]|nr:hypothetical protein [Deltaproteobacteria bacterium]